MEQTKNRIPDVAESEDPEDHHECRLCVRDQPEEKASRGHGGDCDHSVQRGRDRDVYVPVGVNHDKADHPIVWLYVALCDYRIKATWPSSQKTFFGLFPLES